MPMTGTGSKSYSVKLGDYKLLEEIGNGASAKVYRAIYLPYNEVVAVKCLDLDRCNSNLDDIRREAQTMSLIDHPNVVRAYCSFAVEHNLWVVMPFMAQGSCMHLMKIAYADGFEEPTICTILKETLKALDYLHKQGDIHRDIKAGNILLDSNGDIKLGDFGVTACIFDKGDRQMSRNTFVGTPCWMAPEVLQQDSGYDFKVDIWSFGITALELAHGHAPFSKYPPIKVLLMTIQNAPPGLDYDRDNKFSKSFKELVAMCLVKDHTKRPTAQKLLKHSFFKHAKPPELTVKKLFAELPPLWDRVKTIQDQDAASLALKKMPSAEQEAISQSVYQRGVSAWNFDIEDLKAQASLMHDDDEFSETKEGDQNAFRPENGSQLTAGKVVCDMRKTPNLSGPLMLPNRASANSLSAPIKCSEFKDSLEDKSKANLVQKGRFSITSQDVDLVKDIPSCALPRRVSQGSALRKSASVGDWISESNQMLSSQFPKDYTNGSLPTSLILPHLQNLLQHTSVQQELILGLLANLQPAEVYDAPQNGKIPPVQLLHSSENGNIKAESSEKESLLLKISELQARMDSLIDELNADRRKYQQLLQQLSALSGQEEGDDNGEGSA